MGRWDNKSAFERFREKYEVDANGCWIWTGAGKSNGGYGSFYLAGKLTMQDVPP